MFIEKYCNLIEPEQNKIITSDIKTAAGHRKTKLCCKFLLRLHCAVCIKFPYRRLWHDSTSSNNRSSLERFVVTSAKQSCTFYTLSLCSRLVCRSFVQRLLCFLKYILFKKWTSLSLYPSSFPRLLFDLWVVDWDHHIRQTTLWRVDFHRPSLI